MEVRPRPTLVVYQFRIDPEFGWMHSRIQTWFPFYIHVCINGREWLGRRMDAAGMHYLRQDNCFPWMEDIARAQCLMDEQIHVDWNTRLQSFADRLNPLHQHIFRNFDAATYYWSAFQCEWATDVMLRPGALRRLEPLLLRHGLLNFSSPDILRFWGKRIRLDGCLPERFNAPITSSLKLRPQGERLKHWWDGNSLILLGHKLMRRLKIARRRALLIGDGSRPSAYSDSGGDLSAGLDGRGEQEADRSHVPRTASVVLSAQAGP